MTDLSLPVDFKEIHLHVESGTEVLHVKGTIEGSNHKPTLTQDGVDWVLLLSHPQPLLLLRLLPPRHLQYKCVCLEVRES